MTSGTDFPPNVKREARRLAAFKCCYCRDEMGDHVHHLLPKEDGGQGILDNAILLCVRCHDVYGHRADKREQLRQARDIWYELVSDKYSAAAVDRLEEMATKTDVDQLAFEIKKLGDLLLANINSGTMTQQDVANVASTMVSSIVAPPSSHRLHPAYGYGLHITAPPLPLRNLRSAEDDPEKK